KLPIVAAGFSFGAAMTLAASCGVPATDRSSSVLRALVAIGLPVRSGSASDFPPAYDYSFLAQCRIPKFFLSGDNDRFATKAELIEAVAAAAEPKDVALVPGADHFFTGHLHAMQSALAGWLKEQVHDPGQRCCV
ncbi:MAG TPA: hypothetical protein VLT57_09455, partial [Bryobacteraceae bacterium]|nr:hypothetical protein [Bryobacteraceae bacterium]